MRISSLFIHGIILHPVQRWRNFLKVKLYTCDLEQILPHQRPHVRAHSFGEHPLPVGSVHLLAQCLGPAAALGEMKKRERDGAAWCPPWRASQRNYLLEAMLSNKGWWLHRLVRRQGVISLEKGETKDSSQQRVQSGRRPWVLPSKWVRRGRSRRASTSERNLMLSEKQWQALFMEEK